MEAELEKQVENLKHKEQLAKAAAERRTAEQIAQKAAMTEKIVQFTNQVERCDDLADELPQLANHLAEFTGATACYIGKIAKPIKGVSKGMREDQDDEAHIINNAKNEI